jgi:hypothetical protein
MMLVQSTLVLKKYIYIVGVFPSNNPIGGEKICVVDRDIVTAAVVMAAAAALY